MSERASKRVGDWGPERHRWGGDLPSLPGVGGIKGQGAAVRRPHGVQLIVQETCAISASTIQPNHVNMIGPAVPDHNLLLLGPSCDRQDESLTVLMIAAVAQGGPQHCMLTRSSSDHTPLLHHNASQGVYRTPRHSLGKSHICVMAGLRTACQSQMSLTACCACMQISDYALKLQFMKNQSTDVVAACCTWYTVSRGRVQKLTCGGRLQLFHGAC